MEYQKIRNFLYNTTCQPSIFRAKTWIEKNDDRRGTYGTGGGAMLKANFCNYSDAYILAKGIITVNSCWV